MCSLRGSFCVLKYPELFNRYYYRNLVVEKETLLPATVCGRRVRRSGWRMGDLLEYVARTHCARAHRPDAPQNS